MTPQLALGMQDQFDYLAGKYVHFTNNDKVMPLKSIGDIGKGQAQEFVGKVKASELYQDENGVRYCGELYLGRDG